MSRFETEAPEALVTDEEALAVERLLEAMLNGVAIKDVHGVPDEVMNGLYAHAYEFYRQGRLDDAEVFFRFLCIYDFYNADYVLGLAAVYQLKKDYQKALDVYALAHALAKEDYRAMLYAGQCNMLLKRKGKAKECFNSVLENSTDVSLQKRAQLFLEGMFNIGE